jgi:hypothetical protein
MIETHGIGRLELMVDRHCLQRTTRLLHRLEEPRREGPVFQFDQPWEGPLSGYCTMLHDSNAGEFKLYYRGLSEGQFECRHGEVTCLATSSDGIRWSRPNLGQHAWQDTTSTNILLADAPPYSHNFTPFLDLRPGVPSEERFKALAGVAPLGLIAYKSADGIHWSRLSDQPVIREGMLDSQNVAFWSEHERCYVCYLRTWTGQGFSGIRTVSRSTSKDFRRWSRPRQMSFGRRPLEHLYTNQTQPYPGALDLYVGIAARFMPDRQRLSESEAADLRVDQDYYSDCSDVVLLTSRGGNRYDRSIPEAFLRPDIGLEHWVSRTNFPANGLVRTGREELSFYLNTHYAQPGAQLCRYTLPLDRLAYLEGRQCWGEMISKPLSVNRDDQLSINMATSAAGAIQVALLADDTTPLPGFTWTECGELIGNELDRSVSWQQQGESKRLGEAGPSRIRLHIRLRDARLYAFRIHTGQSRT